MTPLQIALASFAAFVAVGLIVKVVIGRWMVRSSAPPARDADRNAP